MSYSATVFATVGALALVACANTVPIGDLDAAPDAGGGRLDPGPADTGGGTRPLPPPTDAGGTDDDPADPTDVAPLPDTFTPPDADLPDVEVPRDVRDPMDTTGGPDLVDPPDTTVGTDTAEPPDTTDPPDVTEPTDTTDPPDVTDPTDTTGPGPDCDPTPCTAAGTSCAGDLSRVCTEDADGCLVAADTPCEAGACSPTTGLCVDPGVAVCGDGVVQAGEECDDGNAGVDDGCTPDCMTERPYECANNAGYVACNSTWNFNTAGRNTWGTYPCSGIDYDGQEMILFFRPPTSGPVTLQMNVTDASSRSDWDLIVLDGDSAPRCGPDLQCVAQGISTSSNETVTFTAEAGRLYVLILDGLLPLFLPSTSSARGTLGITCP